MELYNPPHVNLFIEDHCIGFKIGSIGFKKLSKEVRGKKKVWLIAFFSKSALFLVIFRSTGLSQQIRTNNQKVIWRQKYKSSAVDTRKWDLRSALFYINKNKICGYPLGKTYNWRLKNFMEEAASFKCPMTKCHLTVIFLCYSKNKHCETWKKVVKWWNGEISRKLFFKFKVNNMKNSYWGNIKW